jgi:hypothetical protein
VCVCVCVCVHTHTHTHTQTHSLTKIPLGMVSPYGTCRHRALLFKTIADALEPKVHVRYTLGTR